MAQTCLYRSRSNASWETRTYTRRRTIRWTIILHFVRPIQTSNFYGRMYVCRIRQKLYKVARHRRSELPRV